MSDTNVGMGMVPCKKGCRCNECEIERLTAVLEDYRKEVTRLGFENVKLRDALDAAKSMRAELAEDDGFLHSAACWNWAACESSKRQCAVCDFDDAVRAIAAVQEDKA